MHFAQISRIVLQHCNKVLKNACLIKSSKLFSACVLCAVPTVDIPYNELSYFCCWSVICYLPIENMLVVNKPSSCPPGIYTL
jgi:hypothetical protein